MSSIYHDLSNVSHPKCQHSQVSQTQVQLNNDSNLTYPHGRRKRRQVKNGHKIFKNINVLEISDIWNPHEKCIQISTNMLSIGLVIC